MSPQPPEVENPMSEIATTAAAPTNATLVAEAERRVTELENEQTTLADHTGDALRRGRTAEWMQLQVRSEDLPAELTTARTQLWAVRLDQQWAEVERLDGIERTLLTELEAEQHKLDELQAAAPVRADQVTIVEYGLRVARQRTRRDHVQTRHRAAHTATAVALLTIDTLEADITAAGDEIPGPADGLRAPRRPLTATTTLVRTDIGDALADEFDALPGKIEGQREARTLLAGTTPARWAVRYLGGHLFENREHA